MSTPDLSILAERPRIAAMPRTRVLRAYVEEVRSECVRYLRNPGFLLPTLLFPAVFYVMFGVLLRGANGADASRWLLASYGTFGVMAPGLFGFGVSLAIERENGLLALRRALPMPPSAYLLGKLVMTMLVAAVVVSLLLVLAIFLAKVPLTPTQIARLYATLVPGAVPFSALGLLIATFVKGQAAPGFINLLYLPMAFLSGLWIPLHVLPSTLRAIAPAWPSFHLNALSLAAIDMIPTHPVRHVLVLAAFTAGVLWIAVRRLRRVG